MNIEPVTAKGVYVTTPRQRGELPLCVREAECGIRVTHVTWRGKVGGPLPLDAIARALRGYCKYVPGLDLKFRFSDLETEITLTPKGEVFGAQLSTYTHATPDTVRTASERVGAIVGRYCVYETVTVQWRGVVGRKGIDLTALFCAFGDGGTFDPKRCARLIVPTGLGPMVSVVVLGNGHMELTGVTMFEDAKWAEAAYRAVGRLLATTS